MMIKEMLKKITLLLFIFFTKIVWAETWGTEYLKFELPDAWNCQSEETQYMCFPKEAARRKDALIVTAVKHQDPKTDTLEKYYDYLKKPKKVKTPEGDEITSEVHLISYKTINEVKWIDALHQSSEVRDYYTRYLATIHNSVVIVVAYSTSIQKNILYINDLRKMVDSLKITAKIPKKTED